MTFSLKDFPSREIIEKNSVNFPGIDVDSVFTCLKFLKISRELLTSSEKHFTGLGISMGKFIVLMLLFRYRETGGLAPSDLAEKSGVTRATITGLIDGLENAGFVKREEEKKDRRKLTVCLTEHGLAFIKSILPKHFKRIAGIMQELNSQEKRNLADYLEKISAGIEKEDRNIS